MNETFKRHFSHVEIKDDQFDKHNGKVVTIIWKDVDRTRGGGMLVKDDATAQRLRRAIEAGDAFMSPCVQRDLNNKTYICAPWRLRGRAMNIDLARMGY